jgi:hypothetical protein
MGFDSLFFLLHTVKIAKLPLGDPSYNEKKPLRLGVTA